MSMHWFIDIVLELQRTCKVQDFIASRCTFKNPVRHRYKSKFGLLLSPQKLVAWTKSFQTQSHINEQTAALVAPRCYR
ncbi:hypothetical protein BDR06DRAFT_58614 [Suillus hirtellus]|nr:hypothetical protein BDR06DRAFT_58614 [Suillus hirtellus]